MKITALKGSGSGRFALYDAAGAVVDLDEVFSFGNLVNLEIDPQSETVDVNSNDDDTYGELVDTDTETTGVKVKLSSNRFSAQTLAFALQGALSKLSAAGSSVVEEPFVANLEAMSKVPYKGLTVVSITSDDGVTTYDPVTDYTLDAELGYISYPAGTTITDKEALKRSYTYAAESGHRIWVNKAASQKIWFHWKGINRFDKRRWEVFIPLCTIKPDGTINLMSKEAVEASFEVYALLKDGEEGSVKMLLAA